MSYVGVDLHTNSLTACYRTKQGKERIRTFPIRCIADFVKTLRKQDTIAVEATGNTSYFVEQMGQRVKKVIVVDPNQFEVIRKSVRKTDKHDARTLALYLSKDMLPEARMKTRKNAQSSSPDISLPADSLAHSKSRHLRKSRRPCRIRFGLQELYHGPFKNGHTTT